jgi:multimeric flavodoxin WrbA
VRVLGICGSPRTGNSEFLLQQALDAAAAAAPGATVDTWSVRGKKLRPCTACGRCTDLQGECVIKDDFQAARDLWVGADVVIYSVPVYHMGIPGQLKCFIDRLGNSLFARYAGLFPPGHESLPKHLKVIGNIAQGIHVFSGQESTLAQLTNHALLMQCVPSAGDMWESYIGAGAWTSNVIDRTALEDQAGRGLFDAQVAVTAARSIGKRSVEMARILRAGGAALRDELSADPAYSPFLARLADPDQNPDT